MRTKKKGIIAWTMTVAMLAILPVGLAEVIPGVDEPFDPGSYYSPTSISWADSPSPYALEDLASGGGTVYDYTRHIKSQLFGADFVKWLDLLTQTLEIANTQIKKLEAPTQAEMDSIVERNLEATAKLGTDGTLDNKLFRIGDNWGDEAANATLEDQWKVLDEKHVDIAQKAKDAIQADQETRADVAVLLDALSSAEGRMQAEQINGHLNALWTDAKNRQVQLLAAKANLEAIDQQVEADRLNHADQIWQAASRPFHDPYHKRYIEYMRELYGPEKTEHSVFPDFK